MIGAAALAGAVVSLATGWALLADGERGAGGRAWNLCLAFGAGLCVSSLAFFALRGADAVGRAPLWVLDGALLLLAWVLRRRLPPSQPRPRQGEGGDPPAAAALLHALLFAGAVGALFHALLWSVRHPHGWWDAWAIWNLKARFLVVPGPEWQRAFSELIAWSHTDYPLLLPLDVARLWVYAGDLDPRVPAALSIAFAGLCVAGLYGAVRRERGPVLAALAALALLATPAFLDRVAYQTADLPVAFFLLIALGCVGRAWRSEPGSARPWIALGLFAGAALWTKNEGLLIGLCLAAGLAAAAWRAGSPGPRAAWLLAGLGLPAAAWLAFRVVWAGSSDLWAGQGWEQWIARAADPERHWTIVAAGASGLWRGTGGWLLLELALLAGVAGARRDAWRRPEIVAAAVTLLGVAAGYYTVYLLTPRDLAWQLGTSVQRLGLQLWPSALLVLFLTLREPGQWRVWRLGRA